MIFIVCRHSCFSALSPELGRQIDIINHHLLITRIQTLPEEKNIVVHNLLYRTKINMIKDVKGNNFDFYLFNYKKKIVVLYRI